MRVFDFDHAIVREPGRSVVRGLRSDARAVPVYERVLNEHRAYVAALRAAGLEVDVLPPLEDFPDSVFVEDPALVFPEGAVLLRPGAPSRLAEGEEMRSALARHFGRVLDLGGGYADGGDILVTPQTVFIGLSKRTSRAGAEALHARLAELGRRTRIVETPGTILHLKSAAALLGEDTVVATKAASGLFAGFRVLVTPDGEEGAANLLRVNDVAFVGDCYPRTLDLLAKEGPALRPLAVSEIAKLDAGLSCMSLRWHAK
ncbi:MAG: dimethylarginine dimethylaminohydrolase [Alphaproteobacteria bacterium]|nr:dimethylarginine dimethylaminohydrolase [Alphaproteobacteria bacterium]MDE2113129.1 dimethylarginine dimethylaminohydrolase [Alphaproteobacteria bacterium]MDE2492278.1 dimethylarginine dimethylaminohydrolase [Alphaproteobacteria bacterium]